MYLYRQSGLADGLVDVGLSEGLVNGLADVGLADDPACRRRGARRHLFNKCLQNNTYWHESEVSMENFSSHLFSPIGSTLSVADFFLLLGN